VNTGIDWGMVDEVARGPDERHLNSPPSGVDILRLGEIQMDIKLLYPDSKLPTYATNGSGAMDFYEHRRSYDTRTNTIRVYLGVAVEFPRNWSLFMLSRSGHGADYRVRLANCIGLVDSDFRGELYSVLTQDNISLPELPLPDLERPVQGMLVYTPEIKLNIVQELSKTARGEGGFGSTNAKCCYNCAAGEGPCLSTT